VRKTLSSSSRKIEFLKHVIENNDGYRLFYRNGKNSSREIFTYSFQIALVGTSFSVDSEVNNGRGPVDFKSQKAN
jgi:hypothetical protein